MTYESRFPDAPPRIKALRISSQGFPIPWFVHQVPEAEPDLRIADEEKFVRAIKRKLCWICGQPLGRHQVFIIGPMCAVNRVTSEPPNHRQCAEFAARFCPFLSRPAFVRSPREKLAHGEEAKLKPAAGMAIPRNPGVACLWEAEEYKLFRPQGGNEGLLINLGEPTRVDWWREGRSATRDEVEGSIATGLPLLMDLAVQQAGGAEELHRQALIVTKYLPKEEDHEHHHHPAPA